MTWVREGDCPPERCKGRCCTHTGVFFTDPGPEVKAWLKLQQVRGLSVKGDGNGAYVLDMKQTCQHLTVNGLCSLHPSMNPPARLPDRPEYCEVWPTEPSQLINDPYCGFTFSWHEEEAALGASQHG